MIKLGKKFYNHVNDYMYYLYVNECERDLEKNQIDILQEECAELIQALSKLKRGKECAKINVIEEMTHVMISINVVADILGIRYEQIEIAIDEKEKALNECKEE